MPVFRKMSMDVAEARKVPMDDELARERAAEWDLQKAAGWLRKLEHEPALRSQLDVIVNTPFPAGPEERQAWYASVQKHMTQMTDYYAEAMAPASRAWAAGTVLALLECLVNAPQPEPEPGDVPWYQRKKPDGVRWEGIRTALHAIGRNIAPAAIPLLARWADGQSPGSWERSNAFALYAGHAGEASFDNLLGELSSAVLEQQGRIARQLMAIAPASRYAELAPVLLALFDAFPAQEEDSYGHSYEQESLAGLASSLGQCDPGTAAHIQARLRELGPVQVREVQWALAGRTPGYIAALLAGAGAIARVPALRLRTLWSDGGLVRNLLDGQDRLAVFTSRDDDCRSPDAQTVSKLALIAFPQGELEAVTEEEDGGVRFVYAGSVYFIDGAEDDYAGAAAAFNKFLTHIDHPQRVFQLGHDGGETDNEIGAFFFGDPARLPAAASDLGIPCKLS